MSEQYTAHFRKHKYLHRLAITANDKTHAQAQVLDIARSLKANSYKIFYVKTTDSELSDLFRRLSTNDFDPNKCFEWAGSMDKLKYPCIYLFNERKLIKDLVLGYLNIPKKGSRLKMTCENTKCVNPHHFSYTDKGNRILTNGDVALLLTYASQGASAAQLAKLFQVSRLTIYRNLNRERLRTRSANHSGPNGRR